MKEAAELSEEEDSLSVMKELELLLKPRLTLDAEDALLLTLPPEPDRPSLDV